MRGSDGKEKDLVYTADSGPTSNLGRAPAGAVALVADSANRPGSNEPFASRGHVRPAYAGELAQGGRRQFPGQAIAWI